MTNPLSKYFRTPKLYVTLPSQGLFYEPGMIETSVNGEVGVYPLTTIDQIMVKTPDAMLNGDALLHVFNSCVPGIKNVKNLVEPDINLLLLAIKIASSGKFMEIDTKCPSCGEEHQFNIDLNAIISMASKIDEIPIINMDDLIIKIRPYDFEQRNLQILNEIEESKSLKLIDSNEELNDNNKLKELAISINKMANRTFDVVSRSIISITITSTNEVVTDQSHISEFLKGVSKNQADVIIESIKDVNTKGIDSTTNFECSKCGHQWSQSIDFDPMSLFT